MAGDRAAENLARNAAAARAWFATIVKAVETRDKKLEVQIGNTPSMFITEVMTCTKTYGGLELTVLQRATLSGNSAAGTSDNLSRSPMSDCIADPPKL